MNSNRIPAKITKIFQSAASNRNRVLDHLYTNNISNTIILSGDSHANWVSDLARKCCLPSLLPEPR